MYLCVRGRAAHLNRPLRRRDVTAGGRGSGEGAGCGHTEGSASPTSHSLPPGPARTCTSGPLCFPLGSPGRQGRPYAHHPLGWGYWRLLQVEKLRPCRACVWSSSKAPGTAPGSRSTQGPRLRAAPRTARGGAPGGGGPGCDHPQASRALFAWGERRPHPGPSRPLPSPPRTLLQPLLLPPRGQNSHRPPRLPRPGHQVPTPRLGALRG